MTKVVCAHLGALLVALFTLLAWGRTTAVACGDVRDQLIVEYPTYHVDITPSCTDFTDNKNSPHFSFVELNHEEDNDYPSWALLSDGLFSGLEAIRSARNQALTINSGYRSPARNANTPKAPPNSRHVHGDAADIATTSASWDDMQRAGKAANACAEPSILSYPGHVHVDWRGACPVGW